MPWTKLEEMRAQMGEPIKSSHYAKVMRVAKRLNLIEPSLRPAEVTVALTEFTRDINPFLNMPNPIQIDKFGRAVGVGKRKESTARAFVVEGTGEILVNGKTLSEAFGRVHDRESAVWALTATERLDKYNVWVLVEGGGTTGQAEAITLAVAKALVAHEPALKTALRKGMSYEFSAIFVPCFWHRREANVVSAQPVALRAIPGQWRGRSMDMSRPERCLLGSNDRSCADPDFFAAFESSHRRDYAGYLRKNKPEGTAYLGMLAALLYHPQQKKCIYRTLDVASWGNWVILRLTHALSSIS